MWDATLLKDNGKNSWTKVANPTIDPQWKMRKRLVHILVTVGKIKVSFENKFITLYLLKI